MKEKKIKIAIFHLGFFFSGGGEKLVLQEALALKKKGYGVDIFAPVIDKEDCFPDLIKDIKIHSLFFPFSFNFPLRDFMAIVGAVIFTPLTFWRFKKYDCFYGANQPGPLICYFLSKLLKKPYVIYLAQPTRLIYPRKIDLEKGFGKGSFNVFFFLAKVFRPIVKYLDKISIESANMVLINGEYMAGVIEKYYKVSGIVCPAGSEIPKEKRIIKPYILLTNRHFPQKRLDYAIIFLKKITKIYPNMLLIITGASTLYTINLKKLVTDLKLEKNVIFTDFIDEDKLSKLYLHANVYIYTSPEEDFGMGVIEAMGAGVPVVAWNNAGPKTTILDGKTGFLINPYNKQEFVNKILFLIKNKNKNITMGITAKKHVSNNFTFAKHNRILEQTLLKVIKN